MQSSEIKRGESLYNLPGFAQEFLPLAVHRILAPKERSAQMKYFCVSLLSLLLLSASVVPAAQGQVPVSARRGGLQLTAGGIGSLFQPDYGPNRLLGVGAYVDARFTRWIQVEGEARWLRFNQYADINETNYLIGPRLPIHTFWRATPYAKFLIGDGRMNFQLNEETGSFTDLTYGGGVDIKMSKRLSLRAIDVEYQRWPKWVAGPLSPYGASVGIGYRFF